MTEPRTYPDPPTESGWYVLSGYGGVIIGGPLPDQASAEQALKHHARDVADPDDGFFDEATYLDFGATATCQYEADTGSPVICGLPATIVHVEQGEDPWNGEPYMVILTLCPRHAPVAAKEVDRTPEATHAAYTQRPI